MAATEKRGGNVHSFPYRERAFDRGLMRKQANHLLCILYGLDGGMVSHADYWRDGLIARTFDTAVEAEREGGAAKRFF